MKHSTFSCVAVVASCSDLPRRRGSSFLSASNGLVDNLKDRESEGSSLATASFCSSQDVSSSQNQWYAFILDGSR